MGNALVLLDESGDLGWKLDQPYLEGGSSRYFTIAASVGVNGDHLKPAQVVRKLSKTYGWTSKNEKKWKTLGSQVKKTFANLTVEMLKSNPNLHLLVSVIDKSKVPDHVRGHHHLLYAWAASSLIAPAIRTLRQSSVCPDELNAGSDKLLESVLRKDLWFHLRSRTMVNRIGRNKSLEDGLAFCDYLAGSIQFHFEKGESEPYNILREHIYIQFPWT